MDMCVFFANRMEYLKRISLEEMQSMSYVGKQAAATTTEPCVMQNLVRKSSLQVEIIEQPLVPPTMNFPEMMINTHHVVGTSLNNNNNNVENQLGMMMRDENMLFDHQYPTQPMCYFVPVVTPTNYFHHHQYPMLPPSHAASQRGEYHQMPNDHFHLPNNTTMK